MGAPLADNDRHRPRTAEALFAWLDADGNGEIDVIELLAALRAMGEDATLDDARSLLAMLDRAGTGCIDLPTFVRWARGELPGADPEAELRATFRVMDRDGDGFLSAEDVARHEDVDPAEARRIVRLNDRDGDGRLSYREFRDAVTDPGDD